MVPRVIWKYVVPVLRGSCDLALPQGAEPLSVGFQHDRQLCIWCVVDPQAPAESREVHVALTGSVLPVDPALFACIGRATAGDGAFEAHVFMRRTMSEAAMRAFGGAHG